MDPFRAPSARLMFVFPRAMHFYFFDPHQAVALHQKAGAFTWSKGHVSQALLPYVLALSVASLTCIPVG